MTALETVAGDVAVGAMISANVGPGSWLTHYGARPRTTDVLMPLGAIMLLGLPTPRALRMLGHRLVSWRRTSPS